MDATTVESLHRSFCRCWIVVFNEAVIKALALDVFSDHELTYTQMCEGGTRIVGGRMWSTGCQKGMKRKLGSASFFLLCPRCRFLLNAVWNLKAHRW